MNQDEALKHFHEVIVPEWMPEIHGLAKNLYDEYKQTTRVTSPSELYEHGIMGLMSAFIKWNPNIAKARKSGFRTFARKAIEGHIRNAITGIKSHGKQGVIDPGIEAEARKFNRRQAQQQQAQQEQAPATPALPNKPKF